MSNLDVGARTIADWKKSERHGAREWLVERFTSLALLPLTAWGLYSGYTLAGGGYDAAVAFIKVPLNAALLGLTVLISVWHMNLGLKVIIDDYIAKPATRGALTFLVFLLSLALLGAGGVSLYLIQGL
jgi:succinate dehydrogenase / fumarate reductase, membrane anchor subunit